MTPNNNGRPPLGSSHRGAHSCRQIVYRILGLANQANLGPNLRVCLVSLARLGAATLPGGAASEEGNPSIILSSRFGVGSQLGAWPAEWPIVVKFARTQSKLVARSKNAERRESKINRAQSGLQLLES